MIKLLQILSFLAILAAPLALSHPSFAQQPPVGQVMGERHEEIEHLRAEEQKLKEEEKGLHEREHAIHDRMKEIHERIEALRH